MHIKLLFLLYYSWLTLFIDNKEEISDYSLTKKSYNIHDP